MSAAVSRDLPMPASPESSTTWPSPVFAFDQRRNSSSSSSSRPTSSVRPPACIASKRLSTELARSTAQGFHRPGDALELLGPKVLKLEEIAEEPSRASAMTTVFGSAMPCRRAARFGVSPTISCSCASPDPIKIANDHQPGGNPDADLQGLRSRERGHRSDQLQAGPHGRSASSSCACRIAEVNQHTIAHISSRRSLRSDARSRRRTSDRPK